MIQPQRTTFKASPSRDVVTLDPLFTELRSRAHNRARADDRERTRPHEGVREAGVSVCCRKHVTRPEVRRVAHAQAKVLAVAGAACQGRAFAQ